jgi:hypothetical protein
VWYSTYGAKVLVSAIFSTNIQPLQGKKINYFNCKNAIKVIKKQNSVGNSAFWGLYVEGIK